jgi:hypothetical protein
MSYADDLSTELAAAGIPGRRRRRILAEISDHLACDPQADLGSPAELAREWADQLGTGRARRAGLGAFLGLVVAGMLIITAFGLHNVSAGLSFPGLHPASRPLADLGLLLVVIGGQLAFVAGVLAAIRAFRHRRLPVVPRREATVIARRAAVGVGAGMACMVGLALVAIEYRAVVPGWWFTFAVVAAGVGGLALAAVTPLIVSATVLRPVQPGDAGDLFDDLGPFVPPILEGRVWLLAVIIAAGVGALVALGGAAGNDPFDGVARGVADALACLAGFALLGGYLGLRRTSSV